MKQINVLDDAMKLKQKELLLDSEEQSLSAQERLAALEKLGPEYTESNDSPRLGGFSAQMSEASQIDSEPLSKQFEPIQDIGRSLVIIRENAG